MNLRSSKRQNALDWSKSRRKELRHSESLKSSESNFSINRSPLKREPSTKNNKRSRSLMKRELRLKDLKELNSRDNKKSKDN